MAPGKADVEEVDALLWHEDLECNSIKFNKRNWPCGRHAVQRVACNVI